MFENVANKMVILLTNYNFISAKVAVCILVLSLMYGQTSASKTVQELFGSNFCIEGL